MDLQNYGSAYFAVQKNGLVSQPKKFVVSDSQSSLD